MAEKCSDVCVGCEMLIPIQMTSPRKAAEISDTSLTNKDVAAASNKPKRTGSLALFFRKVSYVFLLAHVYSLLS